MKSLLSYLMILSIFSSFASSSEWMALKTPLNTKIQIKITDSSDKSAKVIILAPGQSCNSKGLLFESIEQEAIKRNLNIVRFEWGYCSENSQIKEPSEELMTEVTEMNFVKDYAKVILNKLDKDIIVAGKSLGSIVSYKLFKSNLELNSNILLTPVCSYSTDDEGNPLPEIKNVLDENYPQLLLETRPMFLISGNSDPMCDHIILDKLKNISKDNMIINYVEGNHGFSILNSDGMTDKVATKMNIEIISKTLIDLF